VPGRFPPAGGGKLLRLCETEPEVGQASPFIAFDACDLDLRRLPSLPGRGVLMMELTGHSRAFILPLLLAVTIATLVARTIEPRSVDDARLSNEEVQKRRRQRNAGQDTVARG